MAELNAFALARAASKQEKLRKPLDLSPTDSSSRQTSIVSRRRKSLKRNSVSSTEQLHPRAEQLDLSSVAEVVACLHREDEIAVKAVARVLPSIARAAQAAADAIKTGGRLVYVGAGTSGRLGVLDAAECPPTFGTSPKQVVAIVAGGPKAITRAVEGGEDDGSAGVRAIRAIRVGPNDFVCGITASSTTPFVVSALKAAKAAKAKTALISCNPKPRAATYADIVVLPQTGPELIAGSTRLKAGTATKLILNAISTAAMVSLGKVFRGRMVGVVPANRKLAERAKRMVAELTGLPPPAVCDLLQRAGGQPQIALAMHFTGLSRNAAKKKLEKNGLRELERFSVVRVVRMDRY